MKKLAAVICTLLLAGCSGSEFFENNRKGVGTPSPATLAAFVAETENSGVVDAATGRMITTGEYLIASISYTNEKCHRFFDALEAFKQNSEFLDKVLTAAVAAGSPLLALNASKDAIAYVTSGLSFANQVNKYRTDVFAFATFRDQLKTHVFNSMADYQNVKGLNFIIKSRAGIRFYDDDEGGDLITFQLSTNPPRKITISKRSISRFFDSQKAADLMIARSIAADYASLCSLANMRSIVTKALENTTTGVEPNPAALAPGTSKTNPKPNGAGM